MIRILLALLLLVGPAAFAGDFREPEPLRDLGKAFKIRPVYFVPKDREPAADYAKKIETLLAFVADLYRSSLAGHGIKTTGLDFAFENGALKVNLLRVDKPASHFSGDPDFSGDRQWNRIVPEVEKAFGPASENLYIVFAETYSDGPAKWEWPGGFALGARFSRAGGIGMFSSWILRDEFCATTIAAQVRLLDDATPIKGRIALHAGRMDSPRFEFIEDGFGAVAHELGHALGLFHDTRKDEEDIMGNGFRYLRHNYLNRFASKPRVGFSIENARLLQYSPFLAESVDLSDTEIPKITWHLPESLPAGTNRFEFAFKTTDNAQLGAVALHLAPPDSVIGGGALEGRSVSFTQTVNGKPLAKGKVEATLIVTDRNGNTNLKRGTIKVE